MITAQDIREKTFEKARIGGYDMTSVDDFLEELADEIAASQKENAVLKSKMKVLVDKIEEYRANEEALNLAVLSAQKLAVQIESDARARANAMIADAERQVKAQIGSISSQADAEEKRLADAKAATAEFMETVRGLCNTQLKKLEAIDLGLPTLQEPVAPAAGNDGSVEDAVRSIENSVSRIQPDASVPMNLDLSTDGAQSASPFSSTQTFSL